MPIIPVTKTMPAFTCDRSEAMRIDCEELHIGTRRRVGTEDVEIEVQPGTTKPGGEWVTFASIRVPRRPIKLGTLFSDRYPECKVIVRYTHGTSGLDPNETLTRFQFLMETLDIWERLFESARRNSFTGKKTDTETQITAAMEVLKSTYSFQELMPPGLDREKFEALFAADKNNSDGTVA
jgi:hypothetical protein